MKSCPRCFRNFTPQRKNQVFCKTDECLTYPTTCSACGETKSTEDFYLDKRRNLPYSQCKVCTDVANKKWVEDNPEKRRESALKYASRYAIEKYGITQDQYAEMVEEQENLCAICLNPETKVVYGSVIRLAIDHEHDSGRIRQLLCSNCNSLLGMAGDSIEVLQRCIEYLQKFS